MSDERQEPIDLSEGYPRSGYKETEQAYNPGSPVERLRREKQEKEEEMDFSKVTPPKGGTGAVSPGNGNGKSELTYAGEVEPEKRNMVADPEVAALQVVLDAMRGLDEDQSARVLQYAASRTAPRFMVVPVGLLTGK